MFQKLLQHRPARFFVLVAIVYALYFLASYWNIDPDFGWHLQAGNYIRTYGIPADNPFSYTAPDFKWLNHEWLSDVLTSYLFDIGGYLLLIIVFSGIWTAGILLASRLYDETVVILATLSTLSFAMVRPSAWSLLFFTALERMLDKLKGAHVWFIPALMLVWANIHGSFALGLVMLLFYKIILKHSVPWLVILASFVVTFINPYGYHIYTEIIRTVTDTSANTVSEWVRFSLPSMYVVSLVPLIAIYLAIRRPLFKKIPLFPVFLLLMSLSGIRYYLFFTAGVIKHLEQAFVEFKTVVFRQFKRWEVLYFSITLLIACIIIGMWYRLSTPDNYPYAIAEHLAAEPCEGNVYNHYNYGGYLIWRSPGTKVYIDGRMLNWRNDGERYFEQYERITTDKAFRASEFEKYNVRCVVYPWVLQDFIKTLEKEGWVNTLEADGVVLLERTS